MAINAAGVATIWGSVAPVSRSPLITAQFTGERPRYLGRSAPCMLYAPIRGRASNPGPSMLR